MKQLFGIPVIDGDFALPARLYRGPATPEISANLANPDHPLAGHIQPCTHSQDADDYLADLDLRKWTGKELIPSAYVEPVDIFSGGFHFSDNQFSLDLRQHMERCFPDTPKRDGFISWFVDNFTTLLQHDKPAAKERVMNGYIVYDIIGPGDRLLHIDPGITQRDIIRLNLPGAVGTLVDVTRDGLFHGKTSYKPMEMTGKILAQMSMVQPGDWLRMRGKKANCLSKALGHAKAPYRPGQGLNLVFSADIH